MQIMDGLEQDCSISSVLSMKILQYCTKTSIYDFEDNFVKIHLPNWQFYLSQAVEVRYVEPWSRVKYTCYILKTLDNHFPLVIFTDPLTFWFA